MRRDTHRSKGFFWLATQHDTMLGWDNVGALLQVMKEGAWFASVPEVITALCSLFLSVLIAIRQFFLYL